MFFDILVIQASPSRALHVPTRTLIGDNQWNPPHTNLAPATCEPGSKPIDNGRVAPNTVISQSSKCQFYWGCLPFLTNLPARQLGETSDEAHQQSKNIVELTHLNLDCAPLSSDSSSQHDWHANNIISLIVLNLLCALLSSNSASKCNWHWKSIVMLTISTLRRAPLVRDNCSQHNWHSKSVLLLSFV